MYKYRGGGTTYETFRLWGCRKLNNRSSVLKQIAESVTVACVANESSAGVRDGVRGSGAGRVTPADAKCRLREAAPPAVRARGSPDAVVQMFQNLMYLSTTLAGHLAFLSRKGGAWARSS
jgi:hypothetical protein